MWHLSYAMYVFIIGFSVLCHGHGVLSSESESTKHSRPTEGVGGLSSKSNDSFMDPPHRENIKNARDARILFGELDRQSCFAKVICGLGTKTPTTKTNLINDYAYLVGELFLDSKEETKKVIPKKPSTSKTSPKGDDEEQEQDDDDDDGDEDEDRFRDWYSAAEYRIQTNQMPPLRHSPPVPYSRRRHVFRHYGRGRKNRQLPPTVSPSRQCGSRAMTQSKSCPYNDTQMAEVVTNLRKLMEGDTDSIFTTVSMNVLGVGPNAKGVKKQGGGKPIRGNNGGNTNVVVNLHQPPPAPQPGYAAVPFHALEDNKGSSGAQSGFYIVPLAPPETPPTEPPPTTQEPYQNLLSFLYSVGQLKNDTDNQTVSSKTTSEDPIPQSTFSTSSSELRPIEGPGPFEGVNPPPLTNTNTTTDDDDEDSYEDEDEEEEADDNKEQVTKAKVTKESEQDDEDEYYDDVSDEEPSEEHRRAQRKKVPEVTKSPKLKTPHNKLTNPSSHKVSKSTSVTNVTMTKYSKVTKSPKKTSSKSKYKESNTSIPKYKLKTRPTTNTKLLSSNSTKKPSPSSSSLKFKNNATTAPIVQRLSLKYIRFPKKQRKNNRRISMLNLNANSTSNSGTPKPTINLKYKTLSKKTMKTTTRTTTNGPDSNSNSKAPMDVVKVNSKGTKKKSKTSKHLERMDLRHEAEDDDDEIRLVVGSTGRYEPIYKDSRYLETKVFISRPSEPIINRAVKLFTKVFRAHPSSPAMIMRH